MEAALEEARRVMFSVVASVLGKTGIKPKVMDILVFNCSLFFPHSLLSTMVVNKFEFLNFNLSGMGCSASLLSIDLILARDLLQVHPNSNALVVSTEIITPNSYSGKQRSMLLPNCIFRMGGAAILLSNKSCDRQRAKYRLLHVVRTHMGGIRLLDSWRIPPQRPHCSGWQSHEDEHRGHRVASPPSIREAPLPHHFHCSKAVGTSSRRLMINHSRIATWHTLIGHRACGIIAHTSGGC
ncbi:3-ketoacyl-CoA synthase 5 [Asimina triloba]